VLYYIKFLHSRRSTDGYFKIIPIHVTFVWSKIPFTEVSDVTYKYHKPTEPTEKPINVIKNIV